MADYFDRLGGHVPIKAVKGDAVRVTFDFSISLAGYTSWELFTLSNKGTTTTFAVTISNEASGQGSGVITAAHTATLAVGRHAYGIRCTDSAGDVREMLSGYLFIYPRGRNDYSL